MKKEILTLPEKKLVGLKIRTSYQTERDPDKWQITPCVTRYFQANIPDKTPGIQNPQNTYCVYTDYESDFQGAYTYFIGKEVSAIEVLPEGLDSLVLPSQTYMKFTTSPGPMPQVIIGGWEEIWQMSSNELGGERGYKADFEVYDIRAQDPQQAVVDLYVGIKNHF